MTIRWKRPNDGYVESHDGAWRITPLYCGCTRPQLYSLNFGDRKLSEYATQREAKAHAKTLVKGRTADVAARRPRLKPCKWVRCLICKPMAPCYRCMKGWWPSCPTHLMTLSVADDGCRGSCLAGHPHDVKQFSVGIPPKRGT